MLKSAARNFKKVTKVFYKTSPWFKLLLIAIMLMLFSGIIRRHKRSREGFTQEKQFIVKDGPILYDDFYVNIYDNLLFNQVKNEYEVGEIINKTTPTKQSLLLDIGSGTGKHVALFNAKGIPAQGLDLSPAMVDFAKAARPDLEFKVGNALDVHLFPYNTFTHITCLYFTIYYIQDKTTFFNNCFQWLRPGGYLTIHLVNRNQFNPILDKADPLHLISAQRYAEKRITNSLIKFNDLQYKGNFVFDKNNDKAYFEESFKEENTQNVRKQTHQLYMPTQRHILTLAKEVGFILEAKIDLLAVQYEYQYLYILYKPD
ncbi:SAM-dependent methyltransferase [uncultured Mediterranean phage]|nr:SAM-dependent methyltransferase [uncultured Mediterranean phage]